MTQKLSAAKKAGMLLSTAALSLSLFANSADAASKTYTVQRGDTLWNISSKLSVPISSLQSLNGLDNDRLNAGDKLVYAASSNTVVQKGDTLWSIAAKTKTSPEKLKEMNNLTSDKLYVGQVLTSTYKQTIKPPKKEEEVKPSSGSTYTVQSGDTLWKLSQRFQTTVDDIKKANHLTSDMLYAGVTIVIPGNDGTSVKPTPTPDPPSVTKPVTDSGDKNVTYTTHTIQRGDTIWNLGIEYGIPMSELMKVNGFSQSTALAVGQKIQIPVHDIPVKQTPGAKYGENLDWWTEAQYVFPIGKTARIIDFQTGKTFMIQRTVGANHADSEPLTSKDSEIIKEVWGGEYSWNTRAVIVEVGGRKIAASMASMPHDVEYIKDNDFNGHFDLHFANSTRHKDGKIDNYHQEQIAIAAGLY